MTRLTAERLRENAAAYDSREAFARVENDRLETLPAAFRDGSYHWKDVEWIVRWYCRRPLDGQVHPAEAAFRENDMEQIANAIHDVLEAGTVEDRVSALTTLRGVDVPIASAFLQYLDPDSFAVMDRSSWTVLHRAGALETSYPTEPVTDDYRRFLAVCSTLAEAADLKPFEIARALWRLGVGTESQTPSDGRQG